MADEDETDRMGTLAPPPLPPMFSFTGNIWNLDIPGSWGDSKGESQNSSIPFDIPDSISSIPLPPTPPPPPLPLTPPPPPDHRPPLPVDPPVQDSAKKLLLKDPSSAGSPIVDIVDNTQFKGSQKHVAQRGNVLGLTYDIINVEFFEAGIDKNLPTELKGLFKKDNCDLCSVPLTNQINGRLHYKEDERHFRKIFEWLKERKIKPVKISNLRNEIKGWMRRCEKSDPDPPPSMEDDAVPLEPIPPIETPSKCKLTKAEEDIIRFIPKSEYSYHSSTNSFQSQPVPAEYSDHDTDSYTGYDYSPEDFNDEDVKVDILKQPFDSPSLPSHPPPPLPFDNSLRYQQNEEAIAKLLVPKPDSSSHGSSHNNSPKLDISGYHESKKRPFEEDYSYVPHNTTNVEEEAPIKIPRASQSDQLENEDKALLCDIESLFKIDACNLCGIQWNPKLIPQGHYNGRKHEFKVIDWLKERQRDENGDSLPLEYQFRAKNLISNYINRFLEEFKAGTIDQKHYNRSKFNQRGIPSSGSRRFKDQSHPKPSFDSIASSRGQSSGQKVESNLPPFKPIYCVICKVNLTTKDEATKHLNGKEHLAKLK